MGGDDLGSDDEYLAPITGGASDDDEEVRTEKVAASEESSSKRELIDDDVPPPKKKRKRLGGGELRELGIDIRSASKETQARLLTELAEVKFRPNQVAISSCSDSPGFKQRVQGIISKKKLKKFNERMSPMVVIICMSARRAVQVLKELAPFNVRAVKLFAKHITIEEQKDQMESASFGFAVGTPHRILTLVQQGAMSFDHTQCIVLDTFLNTKNFAVYTLPDTVTHTQQLLKECIQPECNLRTDLRVAFL
jgi:hypothetical protein